MKIVQGDIIFVRVKEIPKDAKIKQDGVIAEGEQSGHFHKLKTVVAVKEGTRTEEIEKMTDGLVYEKNGDLFVKANAPTTIVHNEHNPVVLPKGTYKIKRTREYTPNGWREVQD